jgi:type I restriction enzyme S subunit
VTEFPVVQINGYANVQSGYSFKSSDWLDDGVPVVKIANVKDGRVDHNGLGFVSETVAAQAAKFSLSEGDVLLAMTGYVGEMAVVKESDLPLLLNQRVGRCLPVSPLLDKRFMYYALSSSNGRLQLENLGQGSAQANLSAGDFGLVEITLPPLAEQRAIAGVLGAIDDKIESNRRLTATIEKLVPLVFQAMTTDVELKPLPQVAKLQKGISYRSVDLEDSETAMVTLKSYDRNGGYKPDGLKPYIGDYKPEQVLLPGDMAVAQTDLTQGAEVVGRVIRVPSQDDFKTLVASLDLVIVRPLDAADEAYLYGALLQEDFREHCRSRTSGTTVLHLGSDALPKYLIPWARSDTRKAFANEVQPLLEEHDSLTRESATLERLRDALSPELLSGRLRAKDAASMMENV